MQVDATRWLARGFQNDSDTFDRQPHQSVQIILRSAWLGARQDVDIDIVASRSMSGTVRKGNAELHW